MAHQPAYTGRSPSVVQGLAQKVDRLLRLGFLQSLAALLELLVEVDGGVLHLLVRLGGAADQEEVLVVRQATVSVLAVQADADETEDLDLFWLRFLGHHSPRVSRS